MSAEVTITFLTEIEQTDDEWETWLNGILDDFADIGHVIDVTQEAV